MKGDGEGVDPFKQVPLCRNGGPMLPPKCNSLLSLGTCSVETLNILLTVLEEERKGKNRKKKRKGKKERRKKHRFLSFLY